MAVPPINRKDDNRNAGGKGRKAYSSKHGEHRSFLSEKISPIKGTDLPFRDTFLNKSAVEHLEKVTAAFCSQVNRSVDGEVKFDYHRTDDDNKNVCRLLDIIKRNLPTGYEAELIRKPWGSYGDHMYGYYEEEDDREKTLEFVIYQYSGFNTCDLYNVPVEIVDKVDKEIRTILIHYFAFLWRRTMFQIPDCEENMEFAYALNVESIDNEGVHLTESAEDEDENTKVWRTRYLEGDIRKILNEIENYGMKYVNDEDALAKTVAAEIHDFTKKHGNVEYLPKRYTDKLFKVMRWGLRINNGKDALDNYTASCNRSHYGNDIEYLEDDEFGDYVDILFLFSYGTVDDDDIMDSMLFNLNMGQSCPGDFLVITPLREDGFTPIDKDYPDEWGKWFVEFYQQIVIEKGDE